MFARGLSAGACVFCCCKLKLPEECGGAFYKTISSPQWLNLVTYILRSIDCQSMALVGARRRPYKGGAPFCRRIMYWEDCALCSFYYLKDLLSVRVSGGFP